MFGIFGTSSSYVFRMQHYKSIRSHDYFFKRSNFNLNRKNQGILRFMWIQFNFALKKYTQQLEIKKIRTIYFVESYKLM